MLRDNWYLSLLLESISNLQASFQQLLMTLAKGQEELKTLLEKEKEKKKKREEASWCGNNGVMRWEN